MKTYLGYHFVGDTLRDGRPIPPDGEWLLHDGALKLCKSGLHWSTHPFDALQYATGATLLLIEAEGRTIFGKDKYISRRLKIIKRLDSTNLLRGFARWQAYQVMHLWDAPDMVVRYLQSGGDEDLRDAAWSAAEYASWIYSDKNVAASNAASSAGAASSWVIEKAAVWAEQSSCQAVWHALSDGYAARFDAWSDATADARDDFKFLVDMEFGK